MTADIKMPSLPAFSFLDNVPCRLTRSLCCGPQYRPGFLCKGYGNKTVHIIDKPYKFMVRLPTHLRPKIQDAASYYKRSMNSEIVARLEQSFSGIPSAQEHAALAPDMYDQLETLFGPSRLDPEEERMIRAYRRLSEDKRQALLSLLC